MGKHDDQPSTINTLRPNKLGTAALVLGIICLVFAFIPFFDYGSGVIGLVGLILGLLGMLGKDKKKVIARVGAIVSAVAIILSIVMAVVYTGVFVNSVHKTEAQQAKDAATPVTVVYNVAGDSTDASVTYSTFNDNKSGTEQATNQTLPFSKTVTGTKGGQFSFNSYSLTASNGSTGSSITCTISVYG